MSEPYAGATTPPARDEDELRTVPAVDWAAAVAEAKQQGFRQFDWLGCVDDLDRSETFTVVLRLVRLDPSWRGLRLTTAVPRAQPQLPSIATSFPGAGWHEREGTDLFGIDFVGGDAEPLLVLEHDGRPPLRKDDLLGSRAAVPWPGAKDPSDHGAERGSQPGPDGGSGAGTLPAGRGRRAASSPSRRRMLPPGVPDPEVWGDRTEPGPADPAEVARSLSGGRVRRRRPARDQDE